MRIGFDIGGTKIEVCVLDHKGTTIFTKRVPTPSNYERFLEAIVDLISIAENNTATSTAIGIGLPGAISPATGLIKNSNCTFLNGTDLKKDLQNKLGRPLHLANDANCFTLSEAVDGVGKNHNVVFGAILGTGCGGGIVVNQKLLVGPNAVSGEWGHNPLPHYTERQDGPARVCYCGKRNCIEQYISGTGLQLSYKSLSGENISAEEIIARYEEEESNAVTCYNTLIDQMARSFAAIVNVLDPDVIVLGGGLSNVMSLYRHLPEATSKYVFSDSANIRFEQAKFGDSSGIRGAAWLGL
ncbi:ROK family protein [Vibrio diazotrophicus]|uniref:Transcriptional regulator n=1 Tax=Vibrio diazotrophicus TaxID=685 RepID=A0A2J8I1D1_VIBDI|nr:MULTISPECIES: ROK family protein [Vibrio]MCF7363407.1 ROK family protein [Vibrio sp. A1-b2]MCZ4373998.1 ROK family protein [Vibrio diazotrophicus]PNI04304.1 transcriptional regulator [Vibrio diazotrophicus]